MSPDRSPGEYAATVQKATDSHLEKPSLVVIGKAFAMAASFLLTYTSWIPAWNRARMEIVRHVDTSPTDGRALELGDESVAAVMHNLPAYGTLVVGLLGEAWGAECEAHSEEGVVKLESVSQVVHRVDQPRMGHEDHAVAVQISGQLSLACGCPTIPSHRQIRT